MICPEATLRYYYLFAYNLLTFGLLWKLWLLGQKLALLPYWSNQFVAWNIQESPRFVWSNLGDCESVWWQQKNDGSVGGTPYNTYVIRCTNRAQWPQGKSIGCRDFSRAHRNSNSFSGSRSRSSWWSGKSRCRWRTWRNCKWIGAFVLNAKKP